MNVVRIEHYRDKQVVAALKSLLDMAERGDIHGLAYVIKLGPKENFAGFAGDYERHPEEALKATFVLEKHLRQDIEDAL